jgi:ribosomal 30S subunit maturation factor RimM
MQLRSRAALAALLLTLASVAPLAAQGSERAFTLSERVPAGQWIRVRNVTGEVRVTASSTDRVEITATKHWRRGDPKAVRIESRKSSDGSILVCAFWTENATCSENGYSSHNEGRNNNDTQVDFEVRVPKGVKVGAHSVNGEITVSGATDEVEASTVNGQVDATSSGGPVRGSTVNGSVHARMGKLTGTDDLDFSTVNGSVVAEFGQDIDANIELSTVNGRFQTDWPVTITGRLDPRHLRATLGKGGRRIRLSTVNGNVELRKI